MGILMIALMVCPQTGVGDGWWRTDGNRIKDAAGNVVRFSGVNWHGMDSENRIPHGLWGGTGLTIEGHLDLMKQSGFNLIRLPFSTEIFGGTSPLASAIGPQNSDLLGKTCFEILDRLVAAAGQRGIRIILDYHRLKGGGAPEGGYWYDSHTSEAQWIENWKVLVRRYKDDPTVVGVDLFNEVHGDVTWEADGVNAAKNWRWAAKRCGDAVLAENPNLLVCVQGLDQYEGEGGWWGAVLLGVKDHPIALSVANRLVYTIHDYGPIVWDQPFHQPAAGFPGSLPAHWDHQWGFVHDDGLAPIWVGEWGAVLDDSLGTWSADLRIRERQWFDALSAYIGAKQLSWTWWCWTPESRDTHGILKDDYSGVNTAKLALIAPATYPAFGPSSGGGTTPPPSPGQTAYGGSPQTLGVVEAEDFDEGGEGVAYHDSDATNAGGAYRPTGVDVEACSEGGANVGWIAPGEWLEYTVDVPSFGTWSVTFRIASATAGGTLHLDGPSGALTGPVAIPGTGGWQSWQDVRVDGLALAAGVQVLRLTLDGGSFNLNKMTFVPATPAGGATSAPALDGDRSSGGGCGALGLEVLILLLLGRRRFN